MTTQVYEAVFQNSVFRPVRPVSKAIAEGQNVRLIVKFEDRQNALDLAAGVYEGLSDDEISEVEQIAFDRCNLFGVSCLREV